MDCVNTRRHESPQPVVESNNMGPQTITTASTKLYRPMTVYSSPPPLSIADSHTFEYGASNALHVPVRSCCCNCQKSEGIGVDVQSISEPSKTGPCVQQNVETQLPHNLLPPPQQKTADDPMINSNNLICTDTADKQVEQHGNMSTHITSPQPSPMPTHCIDTQSVPNQADPGETPDTRSKEKPVEQPEEKKDEGPPSEPIDESPQNRQRDPETCTSPLSALLRECEQLLCDISSKQPEPHDDDPLPLSLPESHAVRKKAVRFSEEEDQQQQPYIEGHQWNSNIDAQYEYPELEANDIDGEGSCGMEHNYFTNQQHQQPLHRPYNNNTHSTGDPNATPSAEYELYSRPYGRPMSGYYHHYHHRDPGISTYPVQQQQCISHTGQNPENVSPTNQETNSTNMCFSSSPAYDRDVYSEHGDGDYGDDDGNDNYEYDFSGEQVPVDRHEPTGTGYECMQLQPHGHGYGHSQMLLAAAAQGGGYPDHNHDENEMSFNWRPYWR
ncbi:hypothetical protein DFH27DRAFT_575221 [Peziza echinospora]|nr:hypothetical protein DFH27DRAFT_575221 [Peziza echinospora]